MRYFITEEESRKLIAIAKAKNEIKEYEEELNKYHQTIIGDRVYYIPTAEQMMGWLESKNVYCDIFPINNYRVITSFAFRLFKYNKGYYESNVVEYKSRKEATLAAIDAALDYLIKNKK